jgi:gamma-glutamyltranspeptidase/glutathione hydrolase
MKFFRRFPLLGAMLLVDGVLPMPGYFWEERGKLAFPELADTYRAIAEGGADAFYKGAIAEAIAADMRRNGGILTYEDLASYRSDVHVLGDGDYYEYRGTRYTPGLSIIVVHILNIMENFDLVGMGPDSTAYRHVMLEALRRAWVNFFAYGRDAALFGKGYAAEVADRIRLDKAAEEVEPVPLPGQENTRSQRSGSSPVGSAHTTTLAAADRDGNVFNMLTSLGAGFGSKVVIPGTGIVLNDHMCNFDPVPGRPLSLGPSRRTAQGCHNPVFFRNGKPFLAMSASGARRSMSAVIHVLVHSVDFGMGIQEAINAPRVWAEALYEEVFLDSRIPEGVQRALADMGHRVVSMDVVTHGGFGCPTGVGIDESGRLHGGADPMYGTGVAGF